MDHGMERANVRLPGMRSRLGWASVVLGVAGLAGIIIVPFPSHNPDLGGLLFILPVLSGMLGGNRQ